MKHPVYSAGVSTLGNLSPEALATQLLAHGVPSLPAADAELVVAQLRGSRWRQSGGGSSGDGETLSADAELRWGHDGAAKDSSISHAANLISTESWWVTSATFEASRAVWNMLSPKKARPKLTP